MNHGQIIGILAEFNPPAKFAEDYDSLANLAQQQYFNTATENNDQIALRPFKVNMGVDSDTLPLYVTSGGMAPLPTDYERSYSLTYINNGVQVIVTEVDDKRYDYLKNHPTEVPTKKYPICNMQKNFIRFLPKDLQYVNFEYLKSPTWVHMNTDMSNGYTAYQSNGSVEFEWDDSSLVFIIQIILNLLGIPATIEQINNLKNKSK